jgi:hypothetical protein
MRKSLFGLMLLFGFFVAGEASAKVAFTKDQKALKREYRSLLKRCLLWKERRSGKLKGVGLKRRFLNFDTSQYIAREMMIFFRSSASWYPAKKGQKRVLKSAVLAVDTEVEMLMLPRRTLVVYNRKGRPLYAMITERQDSLGFFLPICTTVVFHKGFGATAHIPPQPKSKRKPLNQWLTGQHVRALKNPQSLLKVLPEPSLFWGVTYKTGSVSITWGKGAVFKLNW